VTAAAERQNLAIRPTDGEFEISFDQEIVRSEVQACFDAYEAALVAGDVDVMNEWFEDAPHTSRFGIAEEHWGASAIREWRRTAADVPEGRRLALTDVIVCSPDVAVVSTLFRYPSSTETGRQSQTWRRTATGWRIVHAHVSQRPDDAARPVGSGQR
jgi:ketosteroid isomerase-like protein